jgi:Amt family ammonium transporter
VFAQKALNGLADGALFGNPGQLGVQATAVAVTIVYSGVMSFILLKLIGAVIPLRASSADESVGLDLSNHGEEAYVHGEAGMTAASVATPTAPKTAPALRSELA